MMSEQGLARVRGVVRRRKLPIVAVTVATLAISVVAISRLEPKYRASAVVRALESQPAKEYVAPTVVEPLGERLKTLRLALMSRPLLAEVADANHLVTGKKSKDDVVSDLRSRLEVKVEGEDTFLVTYEDGDAARAERVVNDLATRFMQHQSEQRERIASATEKALDDESRQLRPDVEQLEKAVRDFKLAHYGALPEQQEQNLRVLDQTTMEINIQSTNLDLENERRRQLVAASISPLRHQEEAIAAELNDARTKYLPDHPEVKRIEAEYQRLKGDRIAEEKELRQKLREHSPELAGLDGEIQRTTALLAGLRARQDDVRKRVTDTAKNGQELARLEADYETAHTKYLGVVSRLREAELASRIELGLAGMRYELVEGAITPTAPAHPNRPLLGLGALFLALLLGMGVGFALDRADSRIYAPAELAAVGRPIELLACVPDVENADAVAMRPTQHTVH